MNISLPAELKAYVDRRTAEGSYQSSSEYVRELIRKDQELQRFRGLLREGLESSVDGAADPEFFDELRARARRL
jgi:antitoxin ParD1/3/4